MTERKHLYKAIRKDNSQWQVGSYVQQNDTTYCFKEDYDAHPNNTKHYIVFDQSMDWGLPNRHLMAEVYGETVCEAVDGLIAQDRQLFEHDIITVTTSHYQFPNYEIVWDSHEFCWCGVRIGEKKNDGFDRIRLNSDWKYEYHGNACEDGEQK